MLVRGGQDAALEHDRDGLAPWARAVVVLAVVLTFVSVAAGLALGFGRIGSDVGEPFTLSSALWIATYIPFVLVAAAILRRMPRHAVGWMLLWVAAVGSPAQASYEYALRALLITDALPAGAIAAWVATWLWAPSLGSMVLVLLLFPDGSFAGRGWRWVALVAVLSTSVLTVVNAVSTWPHRGPVLVGPHEALDQLLAVRVLNVVFPFVLLSAVLAMISVIVRYVRAEGAARRQIALLGHLAAVMAVALVLGEITSGVVAHVVEVIAVPGWFAVAMGFAILRRGLYDLGKIVSRSVSYGLITLVLVGIYAGTVLVLGSAGRALLGDGSNDLVIAASTLLAAAAFGPVRARVQSAVDRRFDRARYDAAQTIEAFGQRLRDELDPVTLKSEVTAVAARTFQPVRIDFWTPPLVDEVGP